MFSHREIQSRKVPGNCLSKVQCTGIVSAFNLEAEEALLIKNQCAFSKITAPRSGWFYPKWKGFLMGVFYFILRIIIFRV